MEHGMDMKWSNMKKIFALSLGCLFCLVSWITFTYFNTNGETFFSPSFCFNVQIQVSADEIGKPITEIAKAAQSLNMEVMKYDYDKSNKTVSVYTSDLNKYTERLKSGTMPDKIGEYVSSKPSKDSKQVGQISVFSVDNTINLYSLASRKPNVSMEQVQVVSSDQEDAEAFVQKVNEIGDGTQYQATFIGGEANDTYGLHDAITQYGKLLVLLIIITTLLALYLLFQELKGETIKKILGYSNRKLVAEFLPRVYVPTSVVMMASVAGITAIALYYYNGLTLGFSFLKVYFALALVLTAFVYAIVFAFHIGLISSIRPVGIIKNKFPYKSVLGTAYAYKLILVLLLVPMIASAIGLYQQNIAYGNSAERLELLKNYVELPLTSDRMETLKGQQELTSGYKKFFAIQNERGALLCNATGAIVEKSNDEYDTVLQQTDEDDFSTPDKEEYVSNNHISINYEYLKQNPIYDVDGNRVQFTNQNEAVVHVLIPEKFKPYEKTLKKQIVKNITSDYYIMDDLGKNGEQQHPDYPVQITWVKDNQNYFTYDPDVGMAHNCYIQDPISYVYNNVSISKNLMADLFSGGNYLKIPVEQSKQNLAYFERDIKACGLEDSVTIVNNAYERVSDKIYRVEQQLRQQIFFSIAYSIVFVVLIFISALTILQAEHRKLYIMSLLGYSAFRCNLQYYAKSIIFWAIVFAVLNLMRIISISTAEIGVCAGICIASLLLEMLVQTVLQVRKGIQAPRG